MHLNQHDKKKQEISKLHNKKTGQFDTYLLPALLMFPVLLSSCSVISGIFKAGMGVGIFAVIAVVAIIVFIVMRSRKNKS